jgi:uncharacterized protein YerC
VLEQDPKAMKKKLKPVFLVLEALWSEDLRDLSSIFPFINGLCAPNNWMLFYQRFEVAAVLGFTVFYCPKYASDIESSLLE